MLKIILWGTGGNAKSFYTFAHDTFKILAVVDNDTEKQGKTFFDIPVIAPSRLKDENFDYLIIASHAAETIKIQAERLIDQAKILSTEHVISIQMLSANNAEAERVLCLETLGWHYHFELLENIFTFGKNTINQRLLDDSYLGGECGARSLFFGARDGAYAFAMEQRGATNITAFNTKETLAHTLNFAIQMRQSQIKAVTDSLENLTSRTYGKFDAIFLYDIQSLPWHPAILLEKLSAMLTVGGRLYFEGLASDFLDNRKALQTAFQSPPAWHNHANNATRVQSCSQDRDDAERKPCDDSPSLCCHGHFLGYDEDRLLNIPSHEWFLAWLRSHAMKILHASFDTQSSIFYGKALKIQETHPTFVPCAPSTANNAPKKHLVYIAGAPRTGTTYLQRTLMRGAQCAGLDEEHYIDLFSSIARRVDQNRSDMAIDEHFNIFFGLLEKYNVPGALREKIMPAIFALVGLHKNFRALGVSLLDAMVGICLEQDALYYIANRPFPERSYTDDLRFYCQESSIFRHLHLILPVRHPLEIWSSGCLKFEWWRNESYSFDLVLKNWLSVYESALKQGGIFIDYNRLKENPQATIHCLTKHLGMPAMEALPFDTSSLRHVALRKISPRQQAAIDKIYADIPFINK